MNAKLSGQLLVALLIAGLAGCTQDEPLAGAPAPAALDGDAIGYYCSMTVADHAGPKAQIFLRGQSRPYWFSAVRDAIAFTRLPGEPKSITAVYVNDMGRGSWEQPVLDNWIEGREAWFVVGSAMVGGMGAPETVPFSERAAAQAFAAANGGVVLRFSEIPEEAVLGPVVTPAVATAPGERAVAAHREGT